MDDRDARWCHRDGSGSAPTPRRSRLRLDRLPRHRDQTRLEYRLDPLALLGAVLLGWDGWLAWSAGGDAWTFEFLIPTAISLGLVVPIAYLFWWFGGFGGADAKALLVLAVLFPTFPKYALGSWTFPTAGTTDIGTFSFTILTNAVLVGIALPIALAIRNAAAGRIAPVMFVGWPVSWERIPETRPPARDTPAGLSRRPRHRRAPDVPPLAGTLACRPAR